MGTATIYREVPNQKKPPRKISIETFLRKYSKGGPGVKYEFNNGIIEKTEAMKLSEHYIILNLQEVFKNTIHFAQKALLTSEIEVWTSETQWRKPDLSFITLAQTQAAAQGYEPVPEFIIEVISPNDLILQVKNKVKEYFNAGVQMVWLIFPTSQSVEIHRASNNYIEECTGNQLCSAEPVVAGFNIKAADIFKLP